MLEQRGNPEMQPVDDQQLPPARPAGGLPVVVRTALIAVILFGIWTAVMLGLVSAGALQTAPAVVLILLAVIVLGVEVARTWRGELRRNRFGESTERRIEQPELDRLLEIEQASVREERRVLLAREFCRLSALALQPDPAARTTWPPAETVASWRMQVAMLEESVSDPTVGRLPPGRPAGKISDADLSDAISALRQYVDRLSRMQRIETDDPEPVRQLTRDQSHLRVLQDQTIAQLREPTSNELER